MCNRTRTCLILLFVATVLSGGSPALAAPGSVTIAGDLQSELGCGGDWDPGCAATHLTYDAGDDVWQGTFSIPMGNWQYKAALDNAWTENYGLHAAAGGDNISLTLGSTQSVKFYYDHKTHWVTDNRNSVIAVAPGSFQSELGCPGDWDPGCLRSWLEDPDGDGTYTFLTTALPTGDYEAKAAINESWDENYGAGGVAGGANIPFSVSSGSPVCFSYVASTRVLSITPTVSCPPPAATSSPGTAATGQRAAALASCKKRARKHHWSHKRLRKCKRNANLLPV